jgi:hypothetical protein
VKGTASQPPTVARYSKRSAQASAMEAEGARRQWWLDVQHDNAPRHQPVDARNFSIPENIETASL